MFGLNALCSSGEHVAVMTEELLTLLRRSEDGATSLTPVWRLALARGQSCSLASDPDGLHVYACVFEEGRMRLFRGARNGGPSLQTLAGTAVRFSARECSLVWSSHQLGVVATSVCGVQMFRWAGSSLSHAVALARHAIAAVALSGDTACVATLDGHVRIAPLDRLDDDDDNRPFLWFTAQRVCGVSFAPTADACAAVCWDGSGALFTRAASSDWRALRAFAPSLLLRAPAMRSPALGAYTGTVLNVVRGGALKRVGDDRHPNVRWIDRDSEADGLCALDEATLVLLSRRGVLIVVRVA